MSDTLEICEIHHIISSMNHMTILGLKFNGKQTYVELEKRRKIVRYLIACLLATLALHVC